MNANDWKFDRYVPDLDDIKAELNSSEIYINWVKKNNPGLQDCGEVAWAFSAGFIRGIKWALDKPKFMEVDDG